MKLKNYLYICLIEELNEFLTEFNIKKNKNKINDEFNDIVAIIILLNKEVNFYKNPTVLNKIKLKKFDIIQNILSIQKTICKILRFGLNNINPEILKSNKDIINNLLLEFFYYNKNIKINKTKISNKKQKVLKYYKLKVNNDKK